MDLNSIEWEDFDYDEIIEYGFPFTATKVLDVAHCASASRNILKTGEPVVLRGFEMDPSWNDELFSLKYLEEHRGTDSKTRSIRCIRVPE